MDLNRSSTLFCLDGEIRKSDTALSLNCFGYGESRSSLFGITKTNNSNRVMPSNSPDDSCRLVLGLGPTPGMYSDDYDPVGVESRKGPSALSEGDSVLKLGLSSEFSSCSNRFLIPVVDEGSTSAKKSGGYMPSLLFAPRLDRKDLSAPHCHDSQLISEPSSVTNYSTSALSSEQRSSNLKRCKFEGCKKGARGATGFCIGHGGGWRCQKPGCNKGAESRTAYCKAHGGGKRCQHLGCTKSAEGRTDHCIAHGGGRRCGHPTGCTKAARGKSGLCIRHGGGKRCTMEGCSRSAEGQAGLCISHGGGRRCEFPACSKGAQGSTAFCKAHGGGRRCVFAGCTKGAEGSTPLCKGHGGGKRCLFDGGGICPKSVHGGTNFCVAHGGGKRCAIAGCTKSARGRTDCCVRHGGGKRCKFENCGKSAQGSTDFCKAHGGGKRCNWGGDSGKCEKFARGKNGLCAAHGSMMQEREGNKGGGKIGPRLFHGLVPEAADSSSGASALSDSIDSMQNQGKRQCLIPPHVLVPLSMKSSSAYSGQLSFENKEEASPGKGGYRFVIPEGRVHGGSLMSLLGGNLENAIDGI